MYYPPVIWALGRVGEQAAHEALLPLLEHQDDAVRAAAAQSLLRFGETEVISRSISRAPFDDWPVTALGLGGGRNASKVLLDRVKRGGADNDCLIALGLLGHLSAVKALYSSLGNEDLARSAATGLYLITGAEIYEEVYVPEEIDEDELFEEELEAYRKEGKVPTKPDGAALRRKHSAPVPESPGLGKLAARKQIPVQSELPLSPWQTLFTGLPAGNPHVRDQPLSRQAACD